MPLFLSLSLYIYTYIYTPMYAYLAQVLEAGYLHLLAEEGLQKSAGGCLRAAAERRLLVGLDDYLNGASRPRL